MQLLYPAPCAGCHHLSHPALRFFLLGCLILSMPVFLRWEFARLMARGPDPVHEPLFRFHRFTRFLIRSIKGLWHN